MTAVLSVERHTISITDGNLTNSTAVSETTNCVPFVTRRVTSEGTSGRVDDYQVHAYFSGSTVVVQRDVNNGDITCEVTVVEFDSARVTVQSSTYQINSGTASGDFTITEVVAANSFAVVNGYSESSSGFWSDHLLRHRITESVPSTSGYDQVTIDRGSSGGTMNGTWYVIEADSSDFSVQTADITIGAGAVASDDTLGSSISNLGKTFLIGGFTADAETVNNYENTADVWIDDVDTIKMQRDDTGSELVWSGFVVEMADSTTVERGTQNQSTADAQEDVTLTAAVETDQGMALLSGCGGSLGGGSFPGNANIDVQDAHVALLLRDSDAGGDLDQLRIEHSIGGGEDLNDISWEVIEWDIGGAASVRRVMVVS